MRHTIEELGEHADDHHEGAFALWQEPHVERGGRAPVGKPWGCKLGTHPDRHYGATPDEAVTAAIDAHEPREGRA